MGKLTREDKIEIFERRKNGESILSLANSFNVYKSTIEYLISLIEKHGYDILRNGTNRVYSKEFKLQAINRVLVDALCCDRYWINFQRNFRYLDFKI